MPHVNQHYRAFISYSHRDAKWAKWLHKALEQYHVPIDAYPADKKLKADGSKRSRRLTPVFRDRDELSASGSLADTIQEALEASENLIVLCSPNSAASQYVNAEIETFRNLCPENEDKVYALVIDGEPPNCFPPALTAGGAEPIAADAREKGDGKADAKLKLIAGILGVGFDRLKQREAKRQRNRLLVMVTVVSTVAVMTSVLALWALKAEKEATKQRDLAQEQRELAVQAAEKEKAAKVVAQEQRELAVQAAKEEKAAKVVAQEQRELAVQAAKEEKAAKVLAEKQRELAEKSAREAKAVLGFFDSKVLAAARPKHQEGGLGIDATIRAAIDAAEPQIAKSFPDQPLVEATIRAAMGTSYWYLGDAKTATPQLERALELRKKELGPKDPKTLKSMRNLANSYQRTGRRQDALDLREETLELEKEVLGLKHEDTLTSASNLSVSYRGAGRFREALALDEETLKLRKEVLGPENPDTISSMGSLASSYERVGRGEKTLLLRVEVLKLFKKVQGAKHPDTLNSMQNLANSYEAAGKSEAALALNEKTLELRKEVQGSKHPDTLLTMYSLGNSYSSANRWKEALALWEDALASMREVLGPGHRDSIRMMNNLAQAYRLSERLTEAEKLYQELITLQEKTSPKDWTFYYNQSSFGEVLTDLKKYAEAEPLLLSGYKGLEVTVPSNESGQARVKFAIIRLVQLYQAWGKADKGTPWQEILDAIEKLQSESAGKKK